jgi:hypothetical protein
LPAATILPQTTIGLSAPVPVRRAEPPFGRGVQHDAVPELRELISPAFFACRLNGDRTAAFAAIYTLNQTADEDRGEPAHCKVLWR